MKWKMKKRVLIILFVNSLVLSCSKGFLNEGIKGSWYGCFSELQYSEIHFYDEFFFNFFPGDDSPQIRRYEIEGDSLFLKEQLKSEDRLFIYRIDNVTNDEIVLRDDLSTIRLHRLPVSSQIAIDISKRPEELRKYLLELSARALESDCDSFR